MRRLMTGFASSPERTRMVICNVDSNPGDSRLLLKESLGCKVNEATSPTFTGAETPGPEATHWDTSFAPGMSSTDTPTFSQVEHARITIPESAICRTYVLAKFACQMARYTPTSVVAVTNASVAEGTMYGWPVLKPHTTDPVTGLLYWSFAKMSMEWRSPTVPVKSTPSTMCVLNGSAAPATSVSLYFPTPRPVEPTPTSAELLLAEFTKVSVSTYGSLVAGSNVKS
mmetsp:Transcript_27893/g.46722  ORF Transcript_27893/g.46722 Transcript_27893/m.46722 type:complete len:227 (+) Transcript_27893:1901-2581(+)